MAEYEYDKLVQEGCYLHHTPAGGTKMKNATNESDIVNHPSHYTQGGIECIDAIRAALTPEEFRGFCKGNIIKYVWRERFKGGNESMEKAGWYLRKAMEGKA